MTREPDETQVRAAKRELDKALTALDEPGAGAWSNLECRVSDLQQRFIATRAESLADIETRLEAIRDMVLALGPGGYLLDVVNATLDDVRVLRTKTR